LVCLGGLEKEREKTILQGMGEMAKGSEIYRSFVKFISRGGVRQEVANGLVAKGEDSVS
jgi:hypothetical protein